MEAAAAPDGIRTMLFKEVSVGLAPALVTIIKKSNENGKCWQTGKRLI
jgi:hypothetical protein